MRSCHPLSVARVLPTLILTIAGVAGAQAAPVAQELPATDAAADEPTKVELSESEDGSDTSEATAAPSVAADGAVAAPAPTPEWKKAMMLYELGDSVQSLQKLRSLAIECGPSGQPGCTDKERAVFYLCVGIVLTGGEDNHDGGVQAMKKARELDPRIGLSSEYNTPPVLAAWREANGIGYAVRKAPPGQAAAVAAKVAPAEPLVPQTSGILLLGGGVKFGVVESDGGAFGVAQLGGSVTLAGHPDDDSGFAIGGRARAGSYFAFDGGDPAGYLGLSAVLGGVVGPRVNDEFGFILGGAGFEYIPVAETAAFAAQFQAGKSFGGFQISGNVDLIVGDLGVWALFGLELGGGLLL